MKSSLWILNSALVLLLLGISGLLILSRPQRPPRKIITVIPTKASVPQQVTPKIDLATIYEKDPFGTVSTTQGTKPSQTQPIAEPVPTPPTERQVSMPLPAQPQFLPPLAITLKGVIFSEFEHDNRAIIADGKTKQESLYKVGDPLLDAEIIRIESNKIMVMRSNGQQETIFVSSVDAHNDPMYQQIEGIRGLPANPIRPQGPAHYLVDPELLKKAVSNLAHFIEILDITTEFEKGRGIGCRIGAIQPNSLGTLLGFQRNDIVTTINGIPTGTAADRLAIYEQIIKMNLDETIKVQVLRNGKPLQLTYTLASFAPRKKPAPVQQSLTRPSIQNVPQRQLPVQQQFSTIPTQTQQPTFTMPEPPKPPQQIPQSGVLSPQTQLPAREVQLPNLDKRAMFENGGRSGMLRPSQP